MPPSPSLSALVVRVYGDNDSVRFLVHNLKTKEQLEFASLEAFQAYLKSFPERRGLL